MATRNSGKVLELKKLLEDLPVDLCTLHDFKQLPEVKETGRTFRENAALKAVTAARAAGMMALADDSGLVVDALDGQPGVFSARFAGEPPDDYRNNCRLLELLKDVPPSRRTARFVCAIVIAAPDGKQYMSEGACEGLVLDSFRGTGGFGYDPLFYIPELQKTYAELTLEEKNLISHRGKALSQAVKILRGLF